MIEKMVLFENQKQLEETRDELERCKRFSFFDCMRKNYRWN